MENALITKDLTKIYSRKAVVNKINLKVKKGEIYGLIGKNGAGKTTTIKLVIGLSKANEGNIELFESDNLKEGRKRFGTVIEYPSLYPYMNARQNVETQRLLLGVKDKTITDDVLEVVGLKDTGRKKAKDFSLGMKQRLAIALALVGNPEFLFLDEPINGLDPMGIKDIRDLILKLNKEKNITILISSHILGELMKIATAYGVINNGDLVEQFDAKDLEKRVRSKLKLKTNDNNKACEILTEEIGVSDYSIEEDGSISVFDHLEESSKINLALANHDIILESINREDGDYESYFISLMGGNKND